MDLKAMTNHQDFYADVNSLQEMKVGGNTKTKEGLQKVAKEFESLYLKMMLDSMRKAEDVWADDNPFNSREQGMFRDMLDSQYAKNLSDSGALGIADMMVKQLSPFIADGQKQPDPLHQQKQIKPLIDLQPKHYDIPGVNPKEYPLDIKSGPQSYDLKIHPRQQTQLQQDFIPGDPDSFVQTMMPYAEKAAKQLGVDPKLLVSQAALETGWGKSLTNENHGFNLFGIKKSSQWQGDVNLQNTTEYVDGNKQSEVAAFKSYDSFESSFQDYAQLIQNRYLVHNSVASADEYVQKLVEGGYATDPNYAVKMMQIYKSDRMNKTDNLQTAAESVKSYQQMQSSELALNINQTI